MSSHCTNRTVINCTTTLLVAAGLLVACDREDEPLAPSVSPPIALELGAVEEGPLPLPGPTAEAIPTPVALDVDVSQLLPATVELATPMVCGDLTVYDQEDVSTLCSPITLAATPIVSPTCPQVVSGSVRLEVDLECVNSSGLIVGGDNTVIDLNGHSITCTGAGYFGSCQGLFTNGIQVNQRNVHIFSHRPGGTIDGFHHGILVQPNSNNVKVKQLVITGPVGAPGFRRPAIVIGIRVDGVDCEDGIVKLGGGTKTANDISHHIRGIQTLGSTCVLIDQNRIHDNKKNVVPAPGGDQSFGIAIFNSPNIHIVGSVLTNNGDGFVFEGGIALIASTTTSTLINNNEVDQNIGNGIETIGGAVGNYIVNNQMLRNTNRDAFSDQTGVNRWNENNRCVTQTTPQPPPGVCGPDEG